jgi:(p)ppGpp synthase/HD superfamily hydrolase
MGKTKYLVQIMSTMSPNALLIKLCDRLDNVKDATTLPKEKQVELYTDTLVLLNRIVPNITMIHGCIWKDLFNLCKQLIK